MRHVHLPQLRLGSNPNGVVYDSILLRRFLSADFSMPQKNIYSFDRFISTDFMPVRKSANTINTEKPVFSYVVSHQPVDPFYIRRSKAI